MKKSKYSLIVSLANGVGIFFEILALIPVQLHRILKLWLLIPIIIVSLLNAPDGIWTLILGGIIYLMILWPVGFVAMFFFDYVAERWMNLMFILFEGVGSMDIKGKLKKTKDQVVAYKEEHLDEQEEKAEE